MSKLTEPRLDRLVLEPPCPFLTANQRLHWRKRMELTKKWRTAAKEAALDAGLMPLKNAHLVAHIRWPDNRRRDPMNWFITVKAAVDGLVDAGVFEDDDSTRLIGPDMRRETPNGPPRLTLEIKELRDEG